MHVRKWVFPKSQLPCIVPVRSLGQLEGRLTTRRPPRCALPAYRNTYSITSYIGYHTVYYIQIIYDQYHIACYHVYPSLAAALLFFLQRLVCIVAIFCTFSQFCEIGISLLSLQKQPKTAPNLYQRGLEDGKYVVCCLC